MIPVYIGLEAVPNRPNIELLRYYDECDIVYMYLTEVIES